MFHSIRWRLVLWFILLTLLTVTALGILLLGLMRRTIARQTDATLRANAETLAQRTSPFFRPFVQAPAIDQLAQAAALVGDVHVRILDEQQQIIADTGAWAAGHGVTWIVQSSEALSPTHHLVGNSALFPPPLVAFEAISGVPVEVIQIATALSGTAPLPGVDPVSGGASPNQGIVVRRLPSVWGDRIFFDVAASAPITPPSAAISWQSAIFSETADVLLQNMAVQNAFVTGTADFVQMVGADAQNLPPLDQPKSDVFTTPIELGGEVVGYVEMAGASDLGNEALSAIRQALWVATAVAGVLAVVLGTVLSRGLTAPLQELSAVTERMNGGDLSARATVRSQDEIGALAGRFNQMASELESSFAALAAERDALRRFVADASHELRTPITALRTFNELLQQKSYAPPAASDPATQREFLAESQQQIERLERITSDLLNLSRWEGGLMQLELADHDLAEIVAAVLAPFKPALNAQQSALTVDLPTDQLGHSLRLRVDRPQIERLLGNLLDNALKATPVGGQITISAAVVDQTVQIAIGDSGPGIALDDLPFIFERFHRGRNTNYSGSGLGLAIAQSIARAHGGALSARNQPNGGACFTMTLPIVGSG